MWAYIFSIAILAASIYALVQGAELFINQSSALARKYHIPEFLIGITIVAFGTSLPEFIISFIAASQGNVAVSTSNIIGSCIANIGFILAVTALFGAIKINKANLKFDIPLSVFSVIIFLVILYFTNGQINWIAGIVLLVIFAAYFVLVYFREKNKSMESTPTHAKIHPFLIILSIGLIAAGGKFAVDSAIDLAGLLHISNGFAGFTILAIGSSLPELIVSVVALKNGKNALSLGNIIGSNFFNLFFIIGISS
ncbi:MAG: Na+/Ca+ antiporter, CaCA family, partial [candidate division WS6 bacterium GW2011_GWC1_36_11]